MIHQQDKNGGIIVYNYEDFIGLIPGYSSYVFQRLGKGSAYQVAINPFRNLGILAPGFLPVNLTNVTSVVATLNNVAIDVTNSNAWAIEKGAKVHQITGFVGVIGTAIKTTGAFPHTIAAEGTHAAHTTPVGEDIIIFNISGTDYVFYSYNDNTDGDIAQVDLAAATFNEDWFSTTSGGTVLGIHPHPLFRGDDLYLYAGDGNVLRYVAPDGTIGNNSTIVPVGYEIKAFNKNGTHLVIFFSKQIPSGNADNSNIDSYAAFWNYHSLRADFVKVVKDNNITSGINFNGIIGCFTSGRSSEFMNIGYRSKLMLMIGGEFEPIFSFTEAPPTLGGWDIFHQMLVFNAKGTIYAMGIPYKELESNFQFKVTNIARSQLDGIASGICKGLNGTDLYISAGAGASLGCAILGNSNNNYDPNSQWKGLAVEPIFPEGMKGKVKMVEIGFHSTAASGRTMTLRLETDDDPNNTSMILDALTTVSANKQIVYKKLNSSNAALPDFNSIRPFIFWSEGLGATSAPQIRYLKIYYSLIPIVI